jgi:hypothetical protein
MPDKKRPEEKEEKKEEEFRIFYKPKNVKNNPEGIPARKLQLDRLFSQLASSGNTPEENPNQLLLSTPPHRV